MSLLFFILAFVMLVLVYVLFSPMIFYMNTKTNQYYIKILGVLKANLLWHNESILIIRVKTFFKTFDFFPIDSLFSEKRRKKAKKVKSKKRIGVHKGLKIIKTFNVKRFNLDIDTGDSIKNAKLYPVFSFLNYKTGGFNINFQGRNELVLHLQNRPIHILKAFINT